MKLESGGFYVYGASHYGQALMRYLEKIDLLPLAILDRAPRFDSYCGVPVEVFGDQAFATDLPVLVTILGFAGVTESIEAKGFTNIVETLDVFAAYPESLRFLNECGVLWMQAPASSQVDDSKCERLAPLWADAASKQLFDKMVRYRSNPSAEDYALPEQYEMYFPPQVKGLYDYPQLNVLDVGIYDGDTFAGFYHRYGERIEQYTGVEICVSNVEKLKTRLKNMSLPEDFIDVERVAVGLPANAALVVKENASASTVEVVFDGQIESEHTVEAADLGELMNRVQCNILKMDIEGADYDALVQAQQYISTNVPTLALSLYHRPQDLWEIPLLIEDLAPGKYDFYLRQEGHWYLETQFYAVPKSL